MGLFLSRRKKHRNTGCSGNLTAHWQIEARSYCLDCKSQTRSMQGLMPIWECQTCAQGQYIAYQAGNTLPQTTYSLPIFTSKGRNTTAQTG
jgi:ribosomal protein L37AE/L43A